MKLTKIQIERMVRRVFEELKSNNAITFKDAEEKVTLRAIDFINSDYDKERELERDANHLLEKVEKTSSEPIDRHKMFLMIKRKLAEERKFIL